VYDFVVGLHSHDALISTLCVNGMALVVSVNVASKDIMMAPRKVVNCGHMKRPFVANATPRIAPWMERGMKGKGAMTLRVATAYVLPYGGQHVLRVYVSAPFGSKRHL